VVGIREEFVQTIIGTHSGGWGFFNKIVK
jgi:hypothetical protein